MNKSRKSTYTKKTKYLQKKLRGVTLTEILVVMVLSGILFLLLFDGLSIINTYGQLVRGKLNDKLEMLNGHRTLDLLLAKTDSIRKEGNELLLFDSEMKTTRISVEHNRLIHYRDDGSTDTLFSRLIAIRLHFLPDDEWAVDSIFLSLPLGHDTLHLDYGLPPRSGFSLNSKSLNHDTE